jgi:hypothetical protein
MEAKAGASNKNMLQTFQEDIKKSYGPIKKNGTWRSRYNHKLYKLYNEPNKVKVIKVWLGRLFKMQEHNPWMKLTLPKIDDTREVGRPAIRWLDSVEGDLKKITGSGPMASDRKRD